MFNYSFESDDDKNDKKPKLKDSTSEDCVVVNPEEIATPKIQSFDSITELEHLPQPHPPMSPIRDPIIVPITFPTQDETPDNTQTKTQHEMPIDDMLGVIGEGFYRAGEFVNNRLNDAWENGSPALLGFFNSVQAAVQSLGDLAADNEHNTAEPLAVTPPRAESPGQKNTPS